MHSAIALAAPVTITGRQRLLRHRAGACLTMPQTYPYQYQLVSNRDQLVYQGDYRFTPHLTALIGFPF